LYLSGGLPLFHGELISEASTVSTIFKISDEWQAFLLWQAAIYLNNRSSGTLVPTPCYLDNSLTGLHPGVAWWVGKLLEYPSVHDLFRYLDLKFGAQAR
jgi:hypothetical protein